MSVSMETKMATTPLPVPAHFPQAEQSFSLKKRRLPFSSSSTSSASSSSLSPPAPLLSLSLPPRPPSKGCPPVSRVFPQRAPPPWTPLSCSLLQAPPPAALYDPGSQQSYFSQCFTSLGLLGRGSFGEVYKVLSHQDGRLYAVKRSVQRFRGHGERRRSLREARSHERLCPHPHILDLVAAWEEGGRLYIQTELCCTSLLLHAEAQPQAPDEPAAWAYLCDLLSALHHLHSRGFAHLDLKPANVFLTRSGRLKLGDFGLLLEVRSPGPGERGGEGEEAEPRRPRPGRNGEDVQEGDPRYMAPELLEGDYSPAADVFSLGVSMLELVCNMEVPKGGEGWQRLRQGVLPSEFTNGLSGELRALLQMMLVPEPALRPTVPQLLAHPSVRRRRWRRRASLLLQETLLSLLSLCQLVLSSGWWLLSRLTPAVVSRWRAAPPCTPPKHGWDSELPLALSAGRSDSGSLEELLSVPGAVGPETTPPFSHSRVKSRLCVGSSSTPLPNPAPPELSPAPGPSPSSLTPTRSSLTHTPSSIHSPGSRRALSPSLSPVHSLGLTDPPLETLGRPSGSTRGKRARADALPRPCFEPKNLLSLFDDVTLEKEP